MSVLISAIRVFWTALTPRQFWLRHAKICLRVNANSECTDQPAHADQGLHCPLTESLYYLMYRCRENARMSNLSMLGMNLNLCILLML